MEMEIIRSHYSPPVENANFAMHLAWGMEGG